MKKIKSGEKTIDFCPKTVILGHFGLFFGIKSSEISFVLDEKKSFFKV